ncbi:iron-sulfur cluster carrier protein [Microlunatus endophyticus]|uniref:Iron-sulfur cluster carrier protein n=1 Tax=Microlunatus endophyticus TaxID=1716077 RepID=A0A917VZ45_9ACTN|nr:P-loop NTPase [Microlunatus endophyticus]GGL47570.1 iron-sulfur cluster carrier protein [Microlunatus endophyticus]
MPDVETLTPDHPLVTEITKALAGVNDPEIRKPITELGMVKRIDISDGGRAEIEVLLTVAGCPLKDTLRRDVTAAASSVAGVEQVEVSLGVMSDEQRASLRDNLQGGRTEKDIPFARAESLTKVIAIASGKGGVGKSSVTVNLAMALAARGQTVGILDADIYGHSVPAMLGIADARPTSVEDMIMPVPVPVEQGNGLKVMSIGMLKPRRDQVVAWRGPILDRALHQMLADVYWGDLDYLLLDLPPGTGDVAISVGQKLPNAEVIVVTTPQQAAAEVAERAGTMASMVNQRVIGVVENMSYLLITCPDCGKQHSYDVFGSGGGDEVATTLGTRLGYDVPVLARIPLDPQLRAGGDTGEPIVGSDPAQPSATAVTGLADSLLRKGRGLAGRKLNLQPVGR